jgi:hypothetical protein
MTAGSPPAAPPHPPRELALEHAAGQLGDEAYLARPKVLREQRDPIGERTAPAYLATAQSSGCAPSASPSSWPTWQRRRPT